MATSKHSLRTGQISQQMVLALTSCRRVWCLLSAPTHSDGSGQLEHVVSSHQCRFGLHLSADSETEGVEAVLSGG